MAFAVTLTTTIKVDSGEVLTLAKRKVTGLEEVDDRAPGVISKATATLWDSDADGGIADYSLLVLVSDAEVDVELTVQDSDPNQELVSLRVSKDVPLLLVSSAAYYNHAADDVWAGTLGAIDRIRVRENNGADARPRLRLYR